MVFMMGVEWADCPLVAEVVGVKLFINEFVAYQQLSQYKNKRLSGVEEWINGEKQWISVSDNPETSQRGLGHVYLRERTRSTQALEAPRYFPVSQLNPKTSSLSAEPLCYFSSAFWPKFDLEDGWCFLTLGQSKEHTRCSEVPLFAHSHCCELSSSHLLGSLGSFLLMFNNCSAGQGVLWYYHVTAAVVTRGPLFSEHLSWFFRTLQGRVGMS